jgi:hypothetical protein
MLYLVIIKKIIINCLLLHQIVKINNRHLNNKNIYFYLSVGGCGGSSGGGGGFDIDPPQPPLMFFLNFRVFFALYVLRILLPLLIVLFFVLPKIFKNENMDFNDFAIYT